MSKKTLEGRREAWAKDQLVTNASRKDKTWNGLSHMCCGSRSGIRHRVHCKNCKPLPKDDLSDLK